MKILFTGGGSGGHFYPIIGIAQSIRDIVAEKKLIEPEIYFMAPDPYSEQTLFNEKIIYKYTPAGKMRRYFSILNFIDYFKIFFGAIKATWSVFWIFPDVVVSKGGYGSVPAVFAAKILGIPIVIHESDSTPGRANLWAGKFATKIALSYADASKYFDSSKIAVTGNPVRKDIALKVNEGAREYLELEQNIPVILILGGSQGASILNDTIIQALPRLVEKYQIIHQTGEKKYKEVLDSAELVIGSNLYKSRYKPFAYLHDLSMRMAAGAADIVISRAGSTIFEIAGWGIPSIIIPIEDSNLDHQRQNAFNYARYNAAVVIEESNLSTDIIINELDRILNNKDLYKKMSEGAKTFSRPSAARNIAEVVLSVVAEHEKNS